MIGSSSMNETLSTDLAEATRLTRAGRLIEATALIQRLLHGGSAPAQGHAPGRLQRFLDGLLGRRRAEPETGTAAQGRFIAAHYANAAGGRDYKLYIPTTAGKRPRPL